MIIIVNENKHKMEQQIMNGAISFTLEFLTKFGRGTALVERLCLLHVVTRALQKR